MTFQAMHTPDSPRSSQGSELQMRRVEDLQKEAEPLRISQRIEEQLKEHEKNPKFKKVLNRTGLNQDQLDQLNGRIERKFKKLKHIHYETRRSYGFMENIFRKILMAGFGIQAGYWLNTFPKNHEKEWWGASIGIATVGTLGLGYSIYQKRLLERNVPDRAQAINLIAEKAKKNLLDNV